MREFEVVFICTGNRFRSPIAEGLLRAATQGLPVRVHSLGTLQVDSQPPVPEATDLARTLALDLSVHRSRCLDGVDLARADLVIGFELNHVARAVVDAGADRRRTFLLSELVEYLGQIDVPPEGVVVDRADRAVEAAAEWRTGYGGVATAWEIADPAGRPAKEAEQTVAQIAELTATLARRLFAT